MLPAPQTRNREIEPAAIALAMMIAFRLTQGGAAAFTGIVGMLLATALGLACHDHLAANMLRDLGVGEACQRGRAWRNRPENPSGLPVAGRESG
jgi:hypothetical protein